MPGPGSPLMQAALFAPAKKAWSPLDLGAKLIAWWDAENAISLDLAGTAVNSWTDCKGGVVLSQSDTSRKPTLLPNAFNGRACLGFDGSVDSIGSGAVPSHFPVGSSPSEFWALVDQNLDTTQPTARRIIAYGGGDNNTGRFLTRNPVSGGNAVSMFVGIGANVIAAQSGPGFTGVHVVRGITPIAPATAFTASLDGVPGAAANIAFPMATGTDGGIRIGSSTNGGIGLWSGSMNSVLITLPLSIDEAANMLSFLKTRGGVA